MLLAIDIGNTHAVLGIFKGDSLEGHWRVSSEQSRTSDEYCVLIKGFLDLAGFKREDINGVIIASVVPSLTGVFADIAKVLFDVEALTVGPGIRTGMQIRCDDPREVGADRIVNAVAATSIFGGASLVVDFGTATTIDYVSDKGDFMGGAIAPGIGVSMEALFSRASKLPKVSLSKPPSAVGRNTVHAMQSGIYYGYVAMVEGLIKRLKDEAKQPLLVIATGGAARKISTEIDLIDHVDEFLTLKGLQIIYLSNAT
ncbi:MAG: pantothenate kinase [Deltaproteobacteria bacterium]|nr:MAG: pantothenate kinase [Deltaproteobacteria bacterium]